MGSPNPVRVLALVKYVPDAQFDRHIDSAEHRMVRTESILSELDEYAVEAALQLKEASAAGSTVVALTVGPEQAVNAVKKALQMGADEGIHVSDPAIAGSDALATSRVLAAAIEKAGPFDVVITGLSSTDAETSLVPAQLAERLSVPLLSFANSVELEGSTLRITRDSDAVSYVLEADLPAVLSVTDQANEPRYPNFKGIMAAKRKTVETLALADLGVSADEVGTAGSRTVVVASEERPARVGGNVITDDGEAGLRLAEFILAQKVL
ncbi:electron transfer flavoprotein subunit beta/FixA family protein [Neomicrococcus aestuarii]|uniref:electron transfer flavoprotein subunit beta/FixA family protein n=1 Tax=Neomicrococcus aestuarii TaxID=556325 RepID=UPI000A7FD1C8|nr:electron transfer flavoprotein subunit beta/FixA family protein [Neomicrococcus aestuarii]